MIKLDLSTVLVLHVVVLLAGCGAFFHLRRLGVKPVALGWLGTGYGTQALGALFAAMGEQRRVPDWLWQSASLWLGVTGYAFIWAGLCRLSRGQRKSGDENILVLVPLACLGLAVATGTLGSDLDRAVIFHVAAFAFLSAAAVDVYRRDATEHLLSRKLLAVTLILFAVDFLAGISMIVSGTARPERIALVFFVQVLCYFAVALFVSGFLTERIAADLRKLAERDPLTGLSNRARLERLLPRPPGNTTAAIMADIDHFKTVNDRYGHTAGDVVLTEIARLLVAEVRESDVCIRYGGEEFLIISTEKDAPGLAERLRSIIASHTIEISPDTTISVTTSFGVAVPRGASCTWPELLEVADRALYDAKAGGRNRVVVREISSRRGQTVAARA